jgi:exodeoxyribonuclease VII large subunit
MADRTYLTTKFEERNEVKSLGAQWDPSAKRWFVPPGMQLAAFATWLPAGSSQTTELLDPHEDPSPAPRELDTQVKGVPLSRLLGGVGAAVSRAFSEGIWTTAEVVRASVNKGHYYLELSERNADGEVVAQARAVIWARAAQTLLAEFTKATGAELDAGIKVLLRAKPTFNSRFGFSLEVDGIDPSYTLGDLEAKKRDIRERLKREGLFARNRALPLPWDYFSAIVIAPEQGAGLGDFAKEAQRLEAFGICQFAYAHSRFQGEGAAAEIVQAIETALRSWPGSSMPDAVVIIRGGGSVNDLAWLNDYALARCVCECPIPVLTGIGHERDDTSVDEVAHRKYDTPSKVIAGIEDIVRKRSQEARALHHGILSTARGDLASTSAAALQSRQQIESASRTTVVRARADSESLFNTVRLQSVSSVHEARTQYRDVFDHIRGEARSKLGLARQSVPALLATVNAGAVGRIGKARQRVESQLPYVLERANGLTRAAKQSVHSTVVDNFDRASRSVLLAADRSQALFREIAGQGPQKTLQRGFAVVRSSDGKTLTAASNIEDGAQIEVSLRDGIVGAIVRSVTTSADTEGS